MPLFTVIPDVVEGFKPICFNINFEADNFAFMNQSMFLSEVQMVNYKSKAQEEMGIQEEEMNLVNKFFDEEIRGKDASIVLEIYKEFFRDIVDENFKQILIEKITRFKANDFEYFFQLVSICVKRTKVEQQLKFLFQIFSDFESCMRLDQFEQFNKVFLFDQNSSNILNIQRSGKQEQAAEVGQITFQTFQENILKEIDENKQKPININTIQQAKYMFMALTSIRGCNDSEDPQMHEEELKAIYTYIGQNMMKSSSGSLKSKIDIEEYIFKNLQKEQSFFIVEKKFWEEFCAVQPEKFTPRKQIRNLIDNKSLLEQGHVLRLKESITYDQDFILVPKYVFQCLQNWYSCNQVLERTTQTSKIFQNIQNKLHSTKELRTSHNAQSIKEMKQMPQEVSQVSQNKITLDSNNGKIEDLENQDSQNGGQASPDKTSQKSNQIKELNNLQDQKLMQTATGTTSNRISANFVKIIEGIQYELEIYPRLIYFEQINPKTGDKPHLNAIINFRIDQAYCQKYCKGELPFHELSISKRSTLEMVLRYMCQFFKESNLKKARLIVENQVLNGLKLKQTVEDAGIKSGQVVYVEFLQPNNTWPTDNFNEKERAKNRDTNDNIEVIGLANCLCAQSMGLQNLGNTCYMNSAVQCLVNIAHLHEYFVQHRLHLKQINLDSALGHKGQLAIGFGNLIQQMWNSSQVVVPRGFKQVIGKLKEQFKGDDQQDSQEWINFLIDGLHEDTNLRQTKPYIENPQSDNREVLELGLESLSNNLRRDWSFIYFLFYGQIKSSIQCLTCNYEQTIFDVFNNIPVSLPEPSKLLLNIIIYRLPNKIKRLVQNERILAQIEEKEEEKDLKTNLTIGKNLERGGPDIEEERSKLKFKKNYAKLTNDQPIHIMIQVEKNVQIQDLIQQILQIKEVNINFEHYNKQGFQELVLYQMSYGTIRGVFDPSLKLTNYKLHTNEIYAQEQLTTRGKQFIRMRLQQDQSKIEKVGSQCGLEYLGETNVNSDPANLFNDDLDPKAYAKRQQNIRNAYSKYFIFNNHAIATDKFKELVYYDKIPTEILCVAYHRRFVFKENRIFSKNHPQLISSPIILSLANKITGRRIYEEIWSVAQNIIKKTSQLFENKQEKLWWRSDDWKEQLKEATSTSKDPASDPSENTPEKKAKTFTPFIIKTIDRQGYSCSECNWIQRCSGCILEPDDTKPLVDLMCRCNFAIEWQSQFIENEYNPTSNEIMRHSTIYQHEEINEEQSISLEKCLQKFHDMEKLSDTMNCSKCNIQTYHQKSFETFRPPPVLTIQLKRFKQMGNRWRKLQTLVEFPIRNLDLSNFVNNYSFLSSQDISCQYDLVGVINHLGSLTFGHYFSEVKNPFDQQWYRYDDQHRIPINESQITKESAYMLFYQRKDLNHKKLIEIFPDEEKLFPGKPVRTKYGDGFILGSKQAVYKNEEDKFYVKINEDIRELPARSIYSDLDTRFIQLNQYKLEEQVQQQEKLLEQEEQNLIGTRQKSSLLQSFFFCSRQKSPRGVNTNKILAVTENKQNSPPSSKTERPEDEVKQYKQMQTLQV